MVSHIEHPLEPGVQRILTTAIDLFGRHGVKATSLRAIAEQAGVSAPLVIHHFGSKEGLRAACDDRVLAIVRETKHRSMRMGMSMMPGQLDDQLEETRPALRYLAQTLSDGGPRIDAFVEEMVEDAIGYTNEAEAAGLVRPSADPRARITVLVLWALGGLVLHEQMTRLLGVDLLSDGGDASRYTQAVMEVFSTGLFVEGAFAQLLRPEAEPSTQTDSEETT